MCGLFRAIETSHVWKRPPKNFGFPFKLILALVSVYNCMYLQKILYAYDYLFKLTIIQKYIMFLL